MSEIKTPVKVETVEVLKPINDKLVVIEEPVEETTAGGIFIPDQSKEKPQFGKVIAVGEGEKKEYGRHPMDVREGDRIAYTRYSGTEIQIKGQKYSILRERDVLAVIESRS